MDTITFLVASDVHLGYKEKDPIRGRDSFDAFDEIFEIAKGKNVDFVLLGGDLFHDNKPSRRTLHDCMETMTKHCLGDRPSCVQVVSNQVENFGHTSKKTVKCVNYENPNINVSMPVFSIHGNHDDPTAGDGLSAIDLLSVSGLLNHFGKASSMEEIKVHPVLLQQGTTKIALYGLGAIHDDRLRGMFAHKKVKFVRPDVDAEKCYNIMVIHQNRYNRGRGNYIPEDYLDGFFDLVIWGHEHECRTTPETNSEKGFSVLQPGSPVATKLIDAESKKKHAFVIEVCGRSKKIKAVPLQTPRLLYFEEVRLDAIPDFPKPDALGVDEAIVAHCEGRVQSFIEKANTECAGDPKHPLIRLRVDYTGGYPTFDRQSFGRKFKKFIANPDESIVRFKFRPDETSHPHGGGGVLGDGDKTRVEDLILEYLREQTNQMKLLSPKGMEEAVESFAKTIGTDKKKSKNMDPISTFCQENLNEVCKHLKQASLPKCNQESINEEIERLALSNTVQNATAHQTHPTAGHRPTVMTSAQGILPVSTPKVNIQPTVTIPQSMKRQQSASAVRIAFGESTATRIATAKVRSTAGKQPADCPFPVASTSRGGALPQRSSPKKKAPLQRQKVTPSSPVESSAVMCANDEDSDDDVQFVCESPAKIIKLE